MELHTVEVKTSLIAALVSILSFDDDNNGENGIEYLWKEAREFFGISETETDSQKFNNINYLKAKFEKQDLPELELIDCFLDAFFNHDTYYIEHEASVILDEQNKVKYIAVACRCCE